jgi:hypothetical protein
MYRAGTAVIRKQNREYTVEAIFKHIDGGS